MRNALPALVILLGVLLLFSVGCAVEEHTLGVPSTRCLYPGGNSHNGDYCTTCHKHWDGHWYKDSTWRKAMNHEEEVCF